MEVDSRNHPFVPGLPPGWLSEVIRGGMAGSTVLVSSSRTGFAASTIACLQRGSEREGSVVVSYNTSSGRDLCKVTAAMPERK